MSVKSALAIAALGICVACGGGDTPAADDDAHADDAAPAADDAAPAADDAAPAADADGVKSSCNTMTEYSECDNNYPDAYLAGETFLKELCGMVEGEFTAGTACPTENVVGFCDDGAGTTALYYSTGEMAYTTETAKSDCEDSDGTFKAP